MNVGIVAPKGYPHWRVFSDLAHALAASDSDDRCAPVGIIDRSVMYFWTVADGLIVLGANCLRMDPGIRLPANSTIFNLEQHGTGWFDADYLNLLRQHRVWDYSQANIDWLATQGIKAELCRIGYHPCLTRIAPVIEDIDVLFYGSGTERRKAFMHDLKENGINAVWLFDCYGPERDHWIARSKLVLNLHAWDRVPPLEMVRLQLLFANRKCIVSESCLPDDPDWARYRDCLVSIDASKPHEAAFTIKGLLADRETRASVADLGFQMFSVFRQQDLMPCATVA